MACPSFHGGLWIKFSRHPPQPFVLFRNATVQFPDFPALKTLQSKCHQKPVLHILTKLCLLSSVGMHWCRSNQTLKLLCSALSWICKICFSKLQFCILHWSLSLWYIPILCTFIGHPSVHLILHCMESMVIPLLYILQCAQFLLRRFNILHCWTWYTLYIHPALLHMAIPLCILYCYDSQYSIVYIASISMLCMICLSYLVHNILHCIAYMQNAKCFALNHTQHTRYILYTILAVVAIQHRERDGRPYSSYYIYSIWPYLSLYCIAAASIVYIATYTYTYTYMAIPLCIFHCCGQYCLYSYYKAILLSIL